MNKRLAFLVAACVLLFAGALQAEARWNLKFESGKMERISIKTGLKWDAYWYFTYKVTNNTDATVPLRLSIKALSDATDKVIYEGYYKRVEDAVEKKADKNYLNIKDLRTATIDPGESKEIIAILGKVNEATDVLKVHITGLWDRISPEGKKTFVEDRILVLSFYRPGDEYYPQYDRIILKKKEWVVENRKVLR